MRKIFFLFRKYYARCILLGNEHILRVGKTNGFECQGDLNDDWHHILSSLH